jgi:putative drug exporter of the RND superfamily
MNSSNRGIFRYRFFILFLWFFFILVFGFFALQLPDVLKGNGFEYNGEYQQTNRILDKNFGLGSSPIIVLFENDKGLPTEKWYQAISEYLEETKNVAFLEKQLSPIDSPDRMKNNLAYGIFLFKHVDEKELKEPLMFLNSMAQQEQRIKITITGEPVMVEDLNHASQKDLAKAEMIGLPIALIVLVLAFGGLVAASMPLIIGMSSILVSMGIVYFFHHYFQLSIFILNIIPMIGLALSIDFALLFINRYKEELTTKSVEESIVTTLKTAGRSIVFSGLCVFIGLSGLLLFQIDIFQNVAVGGMIVVFVSIFSTLTLLPVLLYFLGEKINALSVLKKKGQNRRGWEKFAKFVMKFPVILTLLSLGILSIGLIPIKDIELKIPGIEAVPPNYESRIAFEKYKENFIPAGQQEENELIMILETKDDIIQEKYVKELVSFIKHLEDEQMVLLVKSPFTMTKVEDPLVFLKMWQDNPSFRTNLESLIHDNQMLLYVYIDGEKTNKVIHDWLSKWEGSHPPFLIHLGGQIKFEEEIFNEINQKAPYGFLLIIVSTLIILTVAFQSILIPIKAIFMNMLSLGATFGIVVWIFQYGHFGMEPVAISLILPVFVFSIVFGLSMDYEVFLISRIHEVYRETRDNSFATVKGLTSTSKIITSAAAIMIVITGAFSFTGVMPIKQIGIGIAIAIFIDATIIRLLLVPALMKLLGDWNWWFFGNKKAGGT